MRNEATLEFVRSHADADVRQLALQGTRHPDVDLPWALDQIAGRQTARAKLPSWAAKEGLVYPPHLSMEQCSSEATARYKAALLTTALRESSAGAAPFASFIDLTGGFGVDFSFLAPLFKTCTYVERQEHLCQCATHNFQLLGLQRANVILADSIDVLHRLGHVSVAYLDPARRDLAGARTYGIADCVPNVLDLKQELRQKTDWVLLKLSPMLDWRKAVGDLGADWVREVHIVAVKNECKELLLLLGPRPARSGSASPVDEAATLLVCTNDDSRFAVPLPLASGGDGEGVASQNIGRGTFLYEPNAAIMKAGCFLELARRYGVSPAARDSHLFFCDRLIGDFPGRKFQISAVSSMNKRELKAVLAGLEQANVAVRNFPMSAADLRRRLKLSDGGGTYIFATTLSGDAHTLFFCTKC